VSYIIKINPKGLPVFSECPADMSIEQIQDIIGGSVKQRAPHAMLAAKHPDLQIVCDMDAERMKSPHNEFATILGNALGGNVYGTAIIMSTENDLLRPLTAAELQDIRDIIEELYDCSVREAK